MEPLANIHFDRNVTLLGVNKVTAISKQSTHNCRVAVKNELVNGTDHSRITLESIAESLGMYPRTLQRHLALSGFSFQRLLDQQRLSYAAELMQNENIKLMDISVRLGYSEQAHFCRAFKRWKGVTPSVYRKMQRQNHKFYQILNSA